VPEGGLPPRVQEFLDRHPGTARVDGPGVVLEPGPHPAVLVTARDEADLRAWTWPQARSAVVAVLLGPGAAALTLDPGGDLPLVELRTRRLARHRWCVLRFAGDVDVADVLTRVARQTVWHDRGRLPVRTGGRGAALRLDERVLNPTGFRTDVTGPVRDLEALPRRVDRALVDDLREARGVVAAGPVGAEGAERVVALALAGVPVVAPAVDPGAVGPRLAAALAAPVDLADDLAREEHSVVLRRAALDAHAAGWAGRPQPSVSVVVATRRADMVEHALAQVGRQRGVDRLELVLAPHGFDLDPARARALLPAHVDLQVRPQAADVLFGDVLQAAYLASGGDVVMKMDDDDWYSPETVLDLLRARAYSGAELVGTPVGWLYVAARDVTVQQRYSSEVAARFVAGGTMMVDRPVLREAGGFRSVRRYVDAQLLGAVLATGAGVYRIHALDYVLRRNPSGHTWQLDADALLAGEKVLATWPGLRPSRLMELG